MHEMSLTRNVVDIVLEEARAANAVEVRSVTVVIGALRDIVEDMFEGLFAHLARGSVAESAELQLIRVPVTVKCRNCSMVYRLDIRDESTYICPSCHQRDYSLNSGMEFYVGDIGIVTKNSAPNNDVPSVEKG